MNIKAVDPRIKLFFVFFLSSYALLFQDVLTLVLTLTIGIIFGIAFGVDLKKLAKKSYKFMRVVVILIIVQSLFIKEGTPILSIGNIHVLTDVGIQRGLGYLFRILVIFLSGAILSTSNMRDTLQGLIQLKLPYEAAFMVTIGVRFMPILVEEMKDAMTAIQLRGVDVKKLKLRQRIEMISYLFMPIITGTFVRAEKLSQSVEARGFRAMDERSSYRKLTLNKRDGIVLCITILTFLVLIMMRYNGYTL